MQLEYDNQPLGLWEDDIFYGESVDHIKGRQLLIYTDGLNEAENSEKQIFGNKRLVNLMSQLTQATSAEVIDQLKEAVEKHRAGADQNDDLTLMCLRIKEEQI